MTERSPGLEWHCASDSVSACCENFGTANQAAGDAFADVTVIVALKMSGDKRSWAETIASMKAAIPGTQQYEQLHGVDEWHALAEQAKSYVPGTVAYQRRTSGDPAYQTTAADGRPIRPVLPESLAAAGQHLADAVTYAWGAITGTEQPHAAQQERGANQPLDQHQGEQAATATATRRARQSDPSSDSSA